VLQYKGNKGTCVWAQQHDVPYLSTTKSQLDAPAALTLWEWAPSTEISY